MTVSPGTEWLALAGRLPGTDRARRSRRLRELARRLGLEPYTPRPVPPPDPVGAKLELTYSCNLRCAFCYTDSPRRTLERATDLPDAEWEDVVSQVIGAGVIEAVLTGGEPLLRTDLALGLLERLDGAGIATTMSTNGWFIDADVADRIAALVRPRISISLDGPTPEVHDRSRGVPGSWRRAVRALSLLVERGVRVQVVHVATPDNIALLDELVEQLRTLGVPALRVTPVVGIGAAARDGRWPLQDARLRRAIARAERTAGRDVDIRLDPETFAGAPVLAPAYLVVRPNGAVMAGAASPFRFGHALDDGIAECWARIVRDWNHPRVRAWREPILHGSPIGAQPAVMYRDDEIDLYGSQEPAAPRATNGGPPRLPRPAATAQAPGPGDLEAARAHVRELVLARRYDGSDVRWSRGSGGRRYVRSTDQEVTLLNPTAARVMDACAPGTAAAAVEELHAAHPDVPVEVIERDVLDAVRHLIRRGILVGEPSGAAADPEPARQVATS